MSDIEVCAPYCRHTRAVVRLKVSIITTDTSIYTVYYAFKSVLVSALHPSSDKAGSINKEPGGAFARLCEVPDSVRRRFRGAVFLWRLLWVGSAPKGARNERLYHHCLCYITFGLPINQAFCMDLGLFAVGSPCWG